MKKAKHGPRGKRYNSANKHAVRTVWSFSYYKQIMPETPRKTQQKKISSRANICINEAMLVPRCWS